MKSLTKIIVVVALVLTSALAFAGAEKQGCRTVSPTSFELCGTLQGPTLPPLPEGWKVLTAADFNGDHWPDILVINEKTGETYIWFFQPNY
jgi:hypothetical protein